ncbi:XrtA-associated tyrosine autokinase [Halochromatium roseum]|uniref:XrtA-associated tyrosine autokinase n=1 Tax=Halochromatium roseum TaxID=391920 RepID=UPI00191241F1|nr:XrtA-associated tyrosine autokinase [Halochromatium roseum]MBK5940394.1 protein tyrosine kinase [Halochromatium roseum]
MSTIEKSLEKLAAQQRERPTLTDPVAQHQETLKRPETRSPHIHTKSRTEIHHFPWNELRKHGILTRDTKRSQLAEEYRQIKRPLLMNIDKKGADIVDNANLILVTSALPREGKTFNAINLAMSIAMERDRTVLLIDGDVAKPTAAKRLGIQQEAGLLDLVDDSNTKINDVLVKTDLPNLRVLPSGRPHDRATELLASEKMARFMSEFSTRYPDRVVIFDSPPLLLASETAVLSSCVGQIVMVVAAEQTSRHTANEALALLDPDKIIGLLLNKYRPSLGNRSGSGYGYGYGYGYGHDHPSPDPDIAQTPQHPAA